MTSIMTTKTPKFSPSVMLSTPQRSAGLPHPKLGQILYREDTAAPFKGPTSKLLLAKVKSGNTWETILITDEPGVKEMLWVGDQVLLTIVRKDKTDLVIGDPCNFSNTKYLAGSMASNPFGLKAHERTPGIFDLVFIAATNPDRSMYNALDPPKKVTQGKLYDNLMVRFWKTWISAERNTVWIGQLRGKDGSLKLEDLRCATPLGQAPLRCPFSAESKVTQWVTIDWDVGKYGVAFAAKDPDLDESEHTTYNLYLLSWKDPSILRKVQMPKGYQGLIVGPSFSSDGKKLVLLANKADGDYFSMMHIIIIDDFNKPDQMRVLFPDNFKTEDGVEINPSLVRWVPDSKLLIGLAVHEGANGIFKVSQDGSELPVMLRCEEAISDFSILDDGRLFISASSLIEDSIWGFMDTKTPTKPKYSFTSSKYGFSAKQIEVMWLPGDSQDIHAFVIKPSFFKKGKKYPLAMLIHGGPQGSWVNGWSRGWNPFVFAEQGYVVVMPNISGSVGFGQKLLKSARRNWGGAPYLDLVHVFDYLEEDIDYIDTDRAVCLGASFGGYMVNWIQGHELGRRFKALVCHDGIFTLINEVSADIQWFIKDGVGGFFWDPKNRENYRRWSPDRFVEHWQTPELVIHSQDDYRLPVAEGLSAFTVLQQKKIPSQLLYFPDEGHILEQSQNKLLWFAVALNFCNKFVGLPSVSEEEWAKDVLTDASTSRFISNC